MEIEYIEEKHLYLIDGIIVPSVTQVIAKIFPQKYQGIPKRILESKADFGTHVHQAVQDFEEKGTHEKLSQLEQVCFDEYLKLKEKYLISPVVQEIIVGYKDLYAGRLDMIADVKCFRCLIDIKTTASVDQEMLAWQLGMYKIAYNQPIEDCYCLWLPKGKPGKLIKITPKTEKEIIKKLNEIKENESTGNTSSR